MKLTWVMGAALKFLVCIGDFLLPPEGPGYYYSLSGSDNVGI